MTKLDTEGRYKSLRVPRTTVWACFEETTREGAPFESRVPVVFFGLTTDGKPVGLVISCTSGLLEDARSFSNFSKFDYDESKKRVQYEPL